MYVIKSLFWQIVNVLIKLILELFVFNRKIRRILKADWARFYLRKYVYKGLKKPFEYAEDKNETAKIIWQYWESEDGEIPEIVQACLNSVEHNRGEYQRVLLTKDTLKDYIDLPEYIYEQKAQGRMNTAHFSDIVRTALLVKHGGVWIDATVLLTSELPNYIKESDLFFFQTDEKLDLDGFCGTNYLIGAKKGEKILYYTLQILLEYWKENNFLVNYFTHMNVITTVCKKFKSEFQQIPFFSFYPVQQLQRELLSDFSEARWEELNSVTSIHKLTHKKRVLTKQKSFEINGTFYEFILKRYGKKVSDEN